LRLDERRWVLTPSAFAPHRPLLRATLLLPRSTGRS